MSAWLEEPAEHSVHRDELRLKLFYGKNISKADSISHLVKRLNSTKEHLAQHKLIEDHIKKEHKEDEASFYWLLTLKGAIYHDEAEIKWCEDVIKALKRDKKH